MRSTFPGHFRPTQEDFVTLWEDSIFVIDANVLLNLYRYSPETRQELERALKSVQQQLFVPHQAAKEFLKNRLTVTAAQAEEYTKAIKAITDVTTVLSHKKKHPFLPDTDLSNFTAHVEKVIAKLEDGKAVLLDRFANDEILEFVQLLSEGRTGAAFDEASLVDIAAEGDRRYQNETPPGYKDGKKDASGDIYRKFGDLILWKQLINKAKSESKPVIFVTDDKKEDWWLEQSGRTIGPRTELREEFFSEVGKNFWMYTVDKFIEETARTSQTTINKDVIAEIIEVRKEVSTGHISHLTHIAAAEAEKYRMLASIANQAEKYSALTTAAAEAEKYSALASIANQAEKYSALTTAAAEAEKYSALASIANQAEKYSALTTAAAEAEKYSALASIANQAEKYSALTTAAAEAEKYSALASIANQAEKYSEIKGVYSPKLRDAGISGKEYDTR